MFATSDLSSDHPLYYCGFPARVRNSWTTSNPGKKWYGCINYKVIFEFSFVLYLIVSSLYIFADFFF
jgi:hypothetical protein